MFAAYMILLSRFSGEPAVTCSIIGAGRQHSSLQDIVGFFVNSIISSTVVDFKEPFARFLDRVNRDLLELFGHQAYPLELVFEELKMRHPEISVTFNMLSMQESAAAAGPGSFAAGHIENSWQAKFDLEPYITEHENGLQVFWNYKKNLFRPGTIAYLAEEYISMMDFFCKNPQESCSGYRRLNAGIRTVSPGEVLPLAAGVDTLTKAFEHQVKQAPDRIAVRTGERHFSYDTLDRDARGVAALIEEKIGTLTRGKQRKSDNIGLLFEHGYHMIAAIIGTLKAGKVYVPLSLSYPLNRLSYMLTNSESSLILTNTANLPTANELALENRVDAADVSEALGNTAAAAKAPGLELSGDTPAYILYTSGSTGYPKGVLQNHRNVLYYTRNWTRVFSITLEDKMTLFSSFCHDGSVQDMFGALLNGAALYLYDVKNREETSPGLSGFLRKEKITLWHSVPSLFSYFANELKGTESFPCLRFILLGGEPLREHEVNMAGKYFPGTILANVYGQTESSVSSTWLIRPGNPGTFSRVVIGEPLDHTKIILLDEEQNAVGPFETGEIAVCCPHIALGYWKNREAAQAVFYNHPQYGTMYRTGDQGRLLADGSIEFRGRKDSQVKIRGFRIELGEIETRLLKHEAIREAVVINKNDDSGSNYLCAYYVPEAPGRGGEADFTLTVSDLREYLSQDLPDYMIPTYFMELEAFPLTPSGKIDRKRLPVTEPARPFKVLGVQQIAVGASDRHQLRALWVDALGLSPHGHFQSAAENVDEEILQLGSGPGSVEVDLMQPLDASKKPRVDTPPLNHIGLWVDDLRAAYDWLRARGVHLAPGGIRQGASGHNVFFIHPRSGPGFPVCGEGVLIELIQAPANIIAHYA